MKSTSSPSVKDIPKMDDEPDSSGTPRTDPSFEPIFATYTTWNVQFTNEERYIVRVPGSQGRISYGRNPSRGGAEVRFYPNQTTKNYVAVLADVLSIVMEGVEIAKPSKSEAEIEREKAAEAIESVRIEKVTEAIMKRTFEPGAWGGS